MLEFSFTRDQDHQRPKACIKRVCRTRLEQGHAGLAWQSISWSRCARREAGGSRLVSIDSIPGPGVGGEDYSCQSYVVGGKRTRQRLLQSTRKTGQQSSESTTRTTKIAFPPGRIWTPPLVNHHARVARHCTSASVEHPLESTRAPGHLRALCLSEVPRGRGGQSCLTYRSTLGRQEREARRTCPSHRGRNATQTVPPVLAAFRGAAAHTSCERQFPVLAEQRTATLLSPAPNERERACGGAFSPAARLSRGCTIGRSSI